MMNHSHECDMFGAQLDFQGVILLMWGATVPLVYYGFYCDLGLIRYGYWILLSFLAAMCSKTTFRPHFRQPYFRPLRAATFGSLAVCTLMPIIHGVFIYGWQLQNRRMGISWVLLTLSLNILGAAAYAFKFPERWFSEIFDIFGASHQIFHIMVVFASLTYSKGILQAFDFVHSHEYLCPK